MKPIWKPDGPTPGLVDYLRCAGEQATYDGFRSHQAGDAYRKLVSALECIQHGLCGYCEIDITEQDRQVEHVIPQSDPERGQGRVLDPENMIVCCKGGTLKTPDVARWQKPSKNNRSCGEAKGNRVDPRCIDPRDLPALPPLMQVNYETGQISADAEACKDASIDVGRVEETIRILGLNVDRLKIARQKHFLALKDNWDQYAANPQIMQEAARMELLPEEGSHCLKKFFSTTRSYFGPVAEEILAETPQEWI